MSIEINREEIIQHGLRVFQFVGSHSICEVCIKNGNSCCLGCESLEDGIGCQKRNTSCTAWLCGFLKFIFYEAELLEEWEQFWEQVPGRAFRTDYTPSVVPIQKVMRTPDIRTLGQAFAKDLARLTKNANSDYIITLNNELDRYVTKLSIYNDIETLEEAKTELEKLTCGFSSFRLTLQEYRRR
ncbi:DNA mismatch repair protein [Neobacillus cucumis]|uniref:DNA mismatch repair protein n=1 Tax=Neobacillus cucumis TaxID=1740721 RepID=UPI0028531F90|nr:DNA mismatch repair protein [Neobacillus cucumis]MDR4950385.1 DNA mismatch repair protein [Neobacillus cucumis]